ncbi:hypothetical protein MHO82_05410 [Vibrio sp. Of7-15]|uniref:hypothetical protein n=1 Tax=Vibrio sp. Of7-15 TaxID=2724879 RepID=UPI001EF29B51|nr:hypothetical protein [Vibrio sp. Of7-15]MCG7496290.1 hypothetical protein [Vibrio sp. Of7-15]
MSTVILSQLQLLMHQNKHLKGLLKAKQALLEEKKGKLASLETDKLNINYALELQLTIKNHSVNLETMHSSSIKAKKIHQKMVKIQSSIDVLEKQIEHLAQIFSKCKTLAKNITLAMSSQALTPSHHIQLSGQLVQQELLLKSHLLDSQR